MEQYVIDINLIIFIKKKREMKIKFAFILFLIFGGCLGATFRKVVIPDPKAVCLDGSRGVYYI